MIAGREMRKPEHRIAEMEAHTEAISRTLVVVDLELAPKRVSLGYQGNFSRYVLKAFRDAGR